MCDLYGGPNEKSIYARHITGDDAIMSVRQDNTYRWHVPKARDFERETKQQESRKQESEVTVTAKQ